MKKLAVTILMGACSLGLGLRSEVQANPGQTLSVQSLAGDLEGTLGGQLPLVLHLRADENGALAATMDSPSQGANGLVGSEVKLDGTTLSYSIAIVGGMYTGTVSADGKTISGTWTQNGNSTPLEWKFTKTAAQADAAAAAAKPSAIDGNWAGALDAGGQTLHIVFHFRTGAGGLVQCSMDSLDQKGAMGIPCGIVKMDGRKISLDVTAVHGTYLGKMRPDGKAIDGTWSQGQPMELDLKKQ
jgi:hypothetical protein